MRRLLLFTFVWFFFANSAMSKPARPLYDPIERERVSKYQPIDDPDVYPIGIRQFKIPFQANSPNATKVRLFVSEDQGKSWKLVTENEPNDTYFRFQADRDGVFWFAALVTLNDGGNSPAEPKLTVNLKVRVKTR